MAAKQVLKIKVLNCGGLVDLMSELESQFLVSALGLFRNRADFGRGKPRANVSLVRAYDSRDFYESAFCSDDILHIVAHASTTELDVGISKKRVLAADLERASRKLKRGLPEIVISTGCELQSADWHKGLGAAGARILIASSNAVTPANLTTFNMSFYSALLARVRKGETTLERVKAAFELADKHYRAVHADGTTFAKFSLVELA